MKKPLNKIALLLWTLAILLALFNAVEIWNVYQNVKPIVEKEAGEWYVLESLTRVVATSVLQFAVLVGLATLIEIADRIWWHVRNSKSPAV